jgi:hypothetical protein
VASKALEDARRATRLAETEARELRTERDRLARENAVFSQRLERKIDSLEHSADPAFQDTALPTPISTGFTNKNTKTRPADIITDFGNMDDPFNDALPTGGLQTQRSKFNPNRLLDILGHPRSFHTPRRAPIPTPEPPYPPFDPLTLEGCRRSAERMINAPTRERALAAERAYLAAVRAVEFEFEEQRSDQYALMYTLQRKNINLPVRSTLAQVVEQEGEEENKKEDEADDKKEDEDQGDESYESDESLEDEEFNVSF